MALQPKRVVKITLGVEEARTLEVLLDDSARKLRVRSVEQPSFAATDLIERYCAIAGKVRVARNPTPPREKAESRRKTPERFAGGRA
jgi:hypothetical protein